MNEKDLNAIAKIVTHNIVILKLKIAKAKFKELSTEKTCLDNVNLQLLLIHAEIDELDKLLKQTFKINKNEGKNS